MFGGGGGAPPCLVPAALGAVGVRVCVGYRACKRTPRAGALSPAQRQVFAVVPKVLLAATLCKPCPPLAGG